MLLAGAMGVQQKLAASELEITGPIAEVSPTTGWLLPCRVPAVCTPFTGPGRMRAALVA
jgi:hypothetical protein